MTILIPTYVDLAHLQFSFLFNALHILVVISPYNTGHDTDNTHIG